jgi:hypothetical protein
MLPITRSGDVGLRGVGMEGSGQIVMVTKLTVAHVRGAYSPTKRQILSLNLEQ